MIATANTHLPVILAVDAGRTKTIALLARTDGTIIGAGRGGCGDIYVDPSFSAIDEALAQALSAASIPIESIAAAVFSMGGADWPEDFVYIREAMQTRLPCPCEVVNDAIGALRCGSPRNVGISVVCGTGTATGARHESGAIWHSSFWQETQGSHHLAEKTLSAVYRADLGIAPSTALTQAVLNFYAVPSVTDLLHHFTARGSTVHAARGRLARVLLDTADQGDPVAVSIVQEHGYQLAEYALAAARKVNLLPEASVPFVLAGSVMRHPTHLLADSLIGEVKKQMPYLQPVFNTYEPVIGSLLLALDSLQVTAAESVHRHLTETTPPASLFAT